MKSSRSSSEHQGVSFEVEPDGQGGVVGCVTVFLTGAECRFTCSMCDLWQYTIDGPTPVGALPKQLSKALKELEAKSIRCSWIKLYNASNFADEHSVPSSDYMELASLCEGFERVIVENHPTLLLTSVGRERTLHFASLLSGRLEVAMGLETVDPYAMSILNKRMSLEEFQRGTEFLTANDIASRAFVLLQPPGVTIDRSVDVCVDTVQFASRCSVGRVSIIPTRVSVGWTTQLSELGQWQPPTAFQLEATVEECFRVPSRTVITADLWDWESILGTCDGCRPMRKERLDWINLHQEMSKTNLSLECDCTEQKSLDLHTSQ